MRINKKNIKNTIMEVSHYGIAETYCHIISRLRPSSLNYMQYLKKREKHLINMDDTELYRETGFLYNQSMGGEKLDADEPKKFTEKIQYLKIYGDSEKKARLADKYAVREWIVTTIGEKYLIPLIAVWDDADEIVALGEAVCIKANHASGMSYIVKNWKEENIEGIRERCRNWMQTPFWALSVEPHYRDIKRKIIAERYIEEMNGNLYDYKFHCFNGIPKFVQCIGERNLSKHTGYQNNYDLEWRELGWIFEDYPKFRHSVQKPVKLGEMCEIAKELSRGFAYVRVDLYEIGDRILFGEMTFTPAGGTYPYIGSWTEERDIELGHMIEI